MPGYIGVPVETNPDVLATRALGYLTDNIPGWVPRDGHLEVWLIQALARMVAEGRDVAASVPTTIFRYFGESVIGLAPVDSAPATVTSTWTMVDAAGYTVPAGVVVAFRTAGDTVTAFEVVDPFTVTPGNTVAAGIVLSAIEEGTLSNGLTGAMELIDSLAYVQSVVGTSVSSGGADAESDDEYLARLVSELQLLAPRPILPNDFAVMARRVPGVHRATALDGYDPNNELQRVVVTATGGTFTLTFSGQTTAAIAWNATAAVVQAALEALSNLAPGDIFVTGGPSATAALDVEFIGPTYGSTNVAQMTFTSSLTGPGAGVVITTVDGGGAPVSGVERVVSVAVVDEDGLAVGQPVKAAVKAMLDAEREINFQVYVIDPTYTAIDVIFDVAPTAEADPQVVLNSIVAALQSYFSPAVWGGGDETPPSWRPSTTVRYLEVAALVNNVPGVDYIRTLTIEGGTANVNLTGAAALTTAGSIVGVVTL